jgi:hypothetical protein
MMLLSSHRFSRTKNRKERQYGPGERGVIKSATGVIKSGTGLGAHASGVLCWRTNQARWKRALPGRTALSSHTLNYTPTPNAGRMNLDKRPPWLLTILLQLWPNERN